MDLGSEVPGLKIYYTIGEVAESIDVAVVITPAPTVPGIVEQCAREGIKAAIGISGHFAEADEGGAKLQQQLVNIAYLTSIRIVGPNTTGVLNTSNQEARTTPTRSTNPAFIFPVSVEKKREEK